MQDNQAFRALFTLPPIQPSNSTALSVPDTPEPKTVTGDREVDAVLWLQECVRTGHQALIDNALQAARKIATPMKELGKRYANYLRGQHRSSMMAALGSMGFGDLESQAKDAIERKQKRHAALSRFGTVHALFSDTAPEAACKKALRGLKYSEATHFLYENARVAERFVQTSELQPNTLADCLHARTYWHQLYWLRASFEGYGDSPAYAQAHEDHCFAMLAKIAPRSKDEALTVLEHLEEDGAKDRGESPAILRNLITGGWA